MSEAAIAASIAEEILRLPMHRFILGIIGA
jgi:hypothetical protein